MKRQAVTRAKPRISADDLALFFTIGFFGLLPIGLTSGLMLMQIFGVWSY
jgi:hypothetical protein